MHVSHTQEVLELRASADPISQLTNCSFRYYFQSMLSEGMHSTSGGDGVRAILRSCPAMPSIHRLFACVSAFPWCKRDDDGSDGSHMQGPVYKLY